MRTRVGPHVRWAVVTFDVGGGSCAESGDAAAARANAETGVGAGAEPHAKAGDGVCSIRFQVLGSALERLRGLLGTRRGDARALPCLLAGCRSVHTFGMAYGIDVALVSEQGRVLRVRRDVPAGQVVSCRGAAHALERPSLDGPWPQAGQAVSLQLFDVL